MKYAILSDIHGNQYALREVLIELEELGINDLLLLGDYVGYYYGIKYVLEQINRYNYVAIRGNHEDLLLKGVKDSNFLKTLNLTYGTSHSRCITSLSREKINFLTQLPKTHQLDIDNIRILLCHGTPWCSDEYIYPNSPEAILARFDEYKYDFIFFGHTHHQTMLEREDKIIINPGSVGQSREKGGMAFWGIFDTKELRFEAKCTAYDVQELEKEVTKYDPGIEYNLKILRR